VERCSRASETERCEAPDRGARNAPDMPGATSFCPVANPSCLALSRTHRTEHRTGRLSGARLSGGRVLSVELGARGGDAPDICPVPGAVYGGLSGEGITARKRFATVVDERLTFKGEARGRPACTGQLSGALESLSGAHALAAG
jgi:hypothetical protein